MFSNCFTNVPRNGKANTSAIIGGIETATHSAGTRLGGLTTDLQNQGGAMPYPNAHYSPEQQQALEFLHLTQKTHEQSRKARLYWIKLGRQYGLKWHQIGDALGMTESSARMMIHRDKQVSSL